MDGDDNIDGLRERLTDMSEGQRYALALVLNLAFVGAVIAGFAFLYSSRNGSGGESAAPAESQLVDTAEPGPSEPAGLDSREAMDADEPVELAENERTPRPLPVAPGARDLEAPSARSSASEAEPEAESDDPGSDVTPFATADLTQDPDSRSIVPPQDADPQDDAAADDPSPGELSAAEVEDAADVEEPSEADDESEAEGEPDAVETAAVDAAPEEDAVSGEGGAEGVDVNPPADAEEGVGADAPVQFAEVTPQPRLAPEHESDAAQAAAPAAPPLDPVGSLWAAAGGLASSLQENFPCSQFTLQAGSDGRPSMNARVGASDDINAVRAQVAASFGDEAEVGPGLGCTAVIAGGYVALSDHNGRISLLGGGQLAREILTVLPRNETCPLIGQVINTQPVLKQQLAATGRPGAWVRVNGEPALCEETEGGEWRVVPLSAVGGRRAAALVVGDDVIATEVRRAANLGPPAGVTPAPTPYEISSFGVTPGAPAPQQGRNLLEIAPIEGPAPQLPPGVPPTPEGYAVTVGFMVNERGEAEDLSVVGAGAARVPIVAAALEVVAASRFPPAQDERYRAEHTVRFPSAEFLDLLERLSSASTSAGGRNASPIWERAPDQDDYDRVYPERALNRSIDGRVIATCTIGSGGGLSCSVRDEIPSNWGFGPAALALAEEMRAAPRMTDGGPSANESVELEFVFTPGEPSRAAR